MEMISGMNYDYPKRITFVERKMIRYVNDNIRIDYTNPNILPVGVLPTEILWEIFSYINNVVDLLNLSMTCKYYAQILLEDKFAAKIKSMVSECLMFFSLFCFIN